MEREPTPDETMGMEWWNHLNEADRAYWLQEARSAVPAEAWAEWNRRQTATPPVAR